MIDSKVLEEAKFYGAFPDALGSAARAFVAASGETPPRRDPQRSAFSRREDPERLANWANALGHYDDDPEVGKSVQAIYKVVDKILAFS